MAVGAEREVAVSLGNRRGAAEKVKRKRKRNETHDRRAPTGRSMRWRGRRKQRAIHRPSSGRRGSAGLLKKQKSQTRRIRVCQSPRRPALRAQTHLDLDIDVDDLKDELRTGTVDGCLGARANRKRLIGSEAEIFRLATDQEPANEGQHGLRRELDVERLRVVGTAIENVEERLVAGFEGQDRTGGFEKVGALEEVSLFSERGAIGKSASVVAKTVELRPRRTAPR